MHRPVPIVALLLLLGASACGRAREGSGDAAATAGDTVAPAVTDSSAAAVPAAPAVTPAGAPAGAPAPATAPSAATPPSGAPAAKPASPYIGRDSAFGPTYEVDSTGKVTPIRVKKPVGA